MSVCWQLEHSGHNFLSGTYLSLLFNILPLRHMLPRGLTQKSQDNRKRGSTPLLVICRSGGQTSHPMVYNPHTSTSNCSDGTQKFDLKFAQTAETWNIPGDQTAEEWIPILDWNVTTEPWNYLIWEQKLCTVNPRFKPQGLINLKVNNHPGSNRERAEIETLKRHKLFNLDAGKLIRF